MNKLTTMLSVATVAVLLSSCSKNETTDVPVMPNDANRIGFGAFSDTKAADNNLTALEGDAAGFKVFATTTPSGIETDHFAASYGYTAGANAWDWMGADDPKYTWPEAGVDAYPMNFVSLYPNTDASLTFANPSTAITIAPKIGDQVDYIRAKGTAADKPATGKITMAFAHILSKVQFSFAVAKDYQANIQSVKVVNVQDHASVASKTPKYNPFTKSWTDSLGQATPTTFVTYGYRTIGTGGTNEGAAAMQTIDAFAADQTVAVENNSKGALMLMPQYGTTNWDASAFAAAAAIKMAAYRTAAGGGSLANTDMSDWETTLANEFKGTRIEVVYNMQKTNATTYAVGALDKFVRVGYVLDLDAIAKAWLAGKQYTYTIALGGDATGGILLDPFYTDETGTPDNNPADIVDQPKVDPGKPVNSTSRIGFDVSVDAWAETTPGIPIIK